ncbi:MAG: hypothetical protein ACKOWW_03615 [Flavobacteriales bacterium]
MGKNSGKYISNKIFGRSWSTPYSHEFTVQKNEDSNNFRGGKKIDDNIDINAPLNDSSKLSNNVNFDQNDKREIHNASNHGINNILEICQQSNRAPIRKNTLMLLLAVFFIGILCLYFVSRSSELAKNKDFDRHNQLEYIELQIRLKLNKGRGFQ